MEQLKVISLIFYLKAVALISNFCEEMSLPLVMVVCGRKRYTSQMSKAQSPGMPLGTK
jgi:hypothetical protein